ncbi:hypothetical protein LTR84_012248 [Exophiala bonariae]|uniref:Uncharacterized protein n=1 Tax=Exophiala bonariae TaxID=1690606 RepID=A0AAV9NG22_9EURO|nr:hypothetical protein LTR84_012248 [Exophiala bonariae]
MAHLIASSPLSSPPPDQSFSKLTTGSDINRIYRSRKDLPFELAQHVQTYYEESLFTQAYTFLLSITGNSISPVNRAAPVTIPSAPHLALAATVSVHPTFTTRTASREKWEQANLAVRLLRLVNQTVGPVNGNLLAAFSFQRNDSRSSRRTHFEDNDEDEYDGRRSTDPLSQDLNTSYAGSQGLWTRADDFWHVVGWAFNCACVSGIHAQRWRRYQVLLEYLLDVLETDWRLREQSNSAEESLMWHYVELAAGGHARERRILRAVFADGSTRSMNEFRPIFANELKEPPADNLKEGGGVKKREVDVNFEQDIFGDYLMQDDSDTSDEADSSARGPGRPPTKRNRTRTPSSRRLTPRNSNGSLRSDHDTGGEVFPSAAAKLAAQKVSSTLSTTTLGDHASLNLRLRLLNLLTHISTHPTLTATSPTTFPDPEDLFTLFVEFIKPLPLPTFTYFILPTPSLTTPLLTLQTSMTLCEFVLQRLLEPSAPSIRSHVLLSQQKLETEYLPFAAARNTADANARVSVLLECLTRCLVQVNHGRLSGEEGVLGRAVQAGVVKRLGRVADVEFHASANGAGAGGAAAPKRKVKGVTAGGAGESAHDEAWACLVESGVRIADVVRNAAALTSASTTV